MSDIERLRAAIRSPEPTQVLDDTVQQLAMEGRTKQELYDRLGQLLLERRTMPDYSESEEDAILDVMDGLTGWCHPSAETRTPVELAEAVLALRFPPEIDLRMQYLMDRNTDGLLTDDESAELASFVEFGESLSLIHARAMRMLGRKPA